MPGIMGFTKSSPEGGDGKGILRKMQDLMAHEDFYAKDDLACLGSVCGSRVHNNTVQKDPQPYERDGIYVWLDGEFFNREEVASQHHVAANTDIEAVHSLHGVGKDFSFLKDLDGIFSAVIFDSRRDRVHLIIDRFGMRHLYWTVHNGCLAWASELKAMLALPGFQPKIDRLAVEQFLSIGYLLADRTWFECVRLVPPGTVLSWDLREHSMRMQRYWWWDEIKPLGGATNRRDIADEVGRLLIDAVKRRSRETGKVGVMLSGGLDSRAVLAAMPEGPEAIQTVTFGTPGCADIRIAASAARVKKAVHHVFEIDSQNWFMPRLAGVWWTDGQLNFMHMHGVEARGLIRQAFQVSLTGFTGDVILGGRFLVDEQFLDRVADRSSVSSILHCDPGILEEIDNYKDLPKIDFYFLQNEVRRFNFGGIKHSLTVVENRMPFLNNRLVEFIYGLTDSLRFQSRIYRFMLLRSFPDFFRTIPWQKTGLPISVPHKAGRALQILQSTGERVARGLHLSDSEYVDPRRFVDYPNWLGQEPAKSFCDKLLNSPSALYPDYVAREDVQNAWANHAKGEARAALLCRYLTFEIWLQQVFEGKYRPQT
jgi:asparagine synthase (glutamine-hydrolysing)